ncbi:MAG: SDR family oxidoreductase [Anaerolineae bacterium]
MTNHLQQKVILITGATGALGSVVTREFAQTSARLVLTSTSEDKLRRLASETGLPEDRYLIKTADLSDNVAVTELVNATVERFGAVDVLLNTAGGWRGGDPVHKTSLEEWNLMLNMNLHSAFLISRAVLPHMLEAGWGRIVHVASKSAVEPHGKHAGYAVSKAGVVTLTDVIADEVKGTGVTANVILPSTIDTPNNRKYIPDAHPEKWVPPEQIAALMRFLCSESAASINGSHIGIYGDL